MSTVDGFKLDMVIEKYNDEWIIRFNAGQAIIEARLEEFVMQPKMMLEPFCEELIKRNK